MKKCIGLLKYGLSAGLVMTGFVSNPSNLFLKNIKNNLNHILLYHFPKPVDLDNIVFVGDSWTLGYTRNLKNAQVIAESGKSSSRVLQNFSNALDKNTEYIVIWCGINNIWNPQQVINDLEEMVKKAKKMNRKFVICNLLPRGAPNKSPGERQQIKQNIKKVNDYIANKWPDNFVDQYSFFEDPKNPGNISEVFVSKHDPLKLHLNNKGNACAQENIFKKIQAISAIPDY